MAQDPSKPRNDGKIGMPKVDGAMNKIAPKDNRVGGKGGAKDRYEGMLGQEPEKKDDEKILARARKRMDRCIQAESDNRRNGLEDLKFKAGDQWPADVIATRQADKRPCLTVNKVKTFVHQVTNEQRENRPSINIHPVGDKGDPEVAKIYRGMIRAIENHSSADIAYDTAFDNAVSNGFGYWRITTEYEDVDTFNQCIRILRVRNPFSVYLDPDHQEPDGADSRYAFVTEMIPRSEFNDKYPDADPVNFDQAGIGESMKNWVTADSIRVAEYYEMTFDKKRLLELSNGFVGFAEKLSPEINEKISNGELQIVQEREAEVPKVTWYKITCKEILERTEWLGKWIPIVPVIGDEIDIEGKVKLSGIIRDMKDPQRMYNYWKTSETELIALAPKAPFIAAEGQIEGHEQEWKQANTKSFPVLQYVPVSLNGTMVPPPQRQAFAGVPAGVVNAAQGSAQDMMAVTGIRFDATHQERMTDESGLAIRELRRTGDIGTFHYMDNLSRSLKHTGRQLLDLIPKIYNSRRMVTILRDDDKEEQVMLDPTMEQGTAKGINPNNKRGMRLFNPKVGDYAVTVTVGPSYATKRIEAAEKMIQFARALPNTAGLIADLIAKNLDWPGAEEMAARLARSIPPNLLVPEPKDMTPQVQAAMQNMQQQIQQLVVERVQLLKQLNDKQADRAQKQDKIDKDFEAKILAIVQKADASMHSHIGSQVKDLAEGVKGLHEAVQGHMIGSSTQHVLNSPAKYR